MERGRENDSPVSPPSLPGERLWRRPGSHCCFPQRGVTRGLVTRGAKGYDYLAASPSAQDQSARNRRLTTAEGVRELVGDS